MREGGKMQGAAHSFRVNSIFVTVIGVLAALVLALLANVKISMIANDRTAFIAKGQ